MSLLDQLFVYHPEPWQDRDWARLSRLLIHWLLGASALFLRTFSRQSMCAIRFGETVLHWPLWPGLTNFFRESFRERPMQTFISMNSVTCCVAWASKSGVAAAITCSGSKEFRS